MINFQKPLLFHDIIQHNIALPVCPQVFMELTQAMAHMDDASFDLARVLSSDPMLTARILRVSNSAFYRASRQISSIREAIVRIGLNEIWTIASALKAKEMFRVSGDGWSQFNGYLWRHSLKTAASIRCLARKLSLLNVEELFTTALLHDIGKSILLNVDHQYATMCKQGEVNGEALLKLEFEKFGTHHGRLGGALLRHWNLPESIARQIDGHHEEPDLNDEHRLPRLLLSIANEMGHSLDVKPIAGSTTIRRLVSRELLAKAGIQPNIFLELEGEADKNFQNLSGGAGLSGTHDGTRIK